MNKNKAPPLIRHNRIKWNKQLKTGTNYQKKQNYE